MTELPSEARDFLDQTRDGHDPPSQAARDRVRQQIATTLSGGAASAAVDARARASDARSVRAPAKLKVVWSAKLSTKLMIFAGGVLIGTALWIAPRRSEPPSNAGPTSSLLAPAAASTAAQSPRATVDRAPHVAAEPVAAYRAGPPRALLAVEPEPAGLPAALPTVADMRPNPGAAARARVDWSGARAPADDLAAELALLHRAAEAIASGDAELALVMLQSYQKRFARPQLREEREGLIALARCTLDASDSRLAQRFIARHASSVLNARLRQACSFE